MTRSADLVLYRPIRRRGERQPVKFFREQSKCVGHDQCHATNADLFLIDSSAYSILEGRVFKSKDEQSTRDSVAACPQTALVLDKD